MAFNFNHLWRINVTLLPKQHFHASTGKINKYTKFPYPDHIPDHILDFILDHILDHIPDHIPDHISDHIPDHILDHYF
ncbi:hypothetical protein FHG87_021024 [Trinorchestia longiramus]|nr:hypothetical protein FHG87_021024 [Trinorchestia longiramus]